MKKLLSRFAISCDIIQQVPIHSMGWPATYLIRQYFCGIPVGYIMDEWDCDPQIFMSRYEAEQFLENM